MWLRMYLFYQSVIIISRVASKCRLNRSYSFKLFEEVDWPLGIVKDKCELSLEASFLSCAISCLRAPGCVSVYVVPGSSLIKHGQSKCYRCPTFDSTGTYRPGVGIYALELSNFGQHPPTLSGATFDKFAYVTENLVTAVYNCSNSNATSLRLVVDGATGLWLKLQGLCAQSICQQSALSKSSLRISLNTTSYVFHPVCESGEVTDGFSRCDFNDGSWTTVSKSGFHCYPSVMMCYWNQVDGRAWYNGHKSTTDNGITCMRWSASYPHRNYHNEDRLYPEDGYSVANASNYCRDPDSTHAPWCYTANLNVRWRFCGVPKCN